MLNLLSGFCRVPSCTHDKNAEHNANMLINCIAAHRDTYDGQSHAIVCDTSLLCMMWNSQ